MAALEPLLAALGEPLLVLVLAALGEPLRAARAAGLWYR